MKWYIIQSRRPELIVKTNDFMLDPKKAIRKALDQGYKCPFIIKSQVQLHNAVFVWYVKSEKEFDEVPTNPPEITSNG